MEVGDDKASVRRGSNGICFLGSAGSWPLCGSRKGEVKLFCKLMENAASTLRSEGCTDWVTFVKSLPFLLLN